jgi:predicted GIY-YIG superfamily endonuclease
MDENEKYKKFLIYKIYQTDDPTMLYIGSTINFKRRKSQHIKNTSNKRSKSYSYPLYKYIRGCGGCEKFTFDIVEQFPCKTKQEGLKREKELIDFMKAKLNVGNPIK